MAALRYPAGLGSVVSREVVPWLWRRSKGLRRLATSASAPHRSELDATQHARIAIETLAGAEAKVLYSGDAAHRPDGTDWDYVVAPVGEDWGPGHTKPSIGTVVWSDNRVSVLKRRGAPPGASSGRALVTGYFSFERGHATAGDIEAQQLVTDWLRRSGRTVDVATAPPFLGGVDWRSVAPEHYDCVFFVCGPFRREPEILAMLRRFGHAKRIGLNLTLLAQHEWEDVLDQVFERDSAHTARPDMAYGADCAKVPVVGVCLREHSGRSDEGDALIAELLGSRALAAVPIDTRLDDLILDGNDTGLRTPAEVESLIARMDVIVTTRLHGLVMALKNGVPVLAIDPGNEGYKICRQAAAVGWPAAIALHNADSATLRLALNYCLSEQGRRDARQCGERGAASIESLKNDVLAAADTLLRA
ncbi:polysaccharide pyruvyl transferase family protein [Devosia sp.]|uniref:polysaccharide pyruvyl transferase family protein n=1 Tax=Devosia sp. TaxID=1871048 RepID=UPI001ACC9A76|nr:polysaccharide pyruvyl transferase family protein [Devosia sp.]MBN9309600.1 polysaccharide pyruvyl transferase family protein [Devosia sp.]